MKKQILSFKNAFSGVWAVIKSESHMRFHMVAAFYVILFSFFYDFTAAQWAILLTLIGFVMTLEIVNTCIEQLCNLCADRYDPLVKLIKDAASGAVLVAAAAAAAVAVIFFWNFDVILSIAGFFACNPVLIVLLALSAVFAVIFILIGPTGIKNVILKFLRNFHNAE